MRKSHFRVAGKGDIKALAETLHYDEVLQTHPNEHDIHVLPDQGNEDNDEIPKISVDEVESSGGNEREDTDKISSEFKKGVKAHVELTTVDISEKPVMIEGEAVEDEEDMDYTEETPLEEPINDEEIVISQENVSGMLDLVEEKDAANINGTDTSISEGLDSLEIKKDQPIVIDDAAFDELKKVNERLMKVKKKNEEKEENRKSTPAERTTRRSTTTNVTYKEDSDEEFERKYLRKYSREPDDEISANNNDQDTRISEVLDCLEIQKEQPIVIDDSAFENLEKVIKKEKNDKVKKSEKFEKRKSTPTLSGRASRRSTRASVTYNEDSDEEFGRKYLRRVPREFITAKTGRAHKRGKSSKHRGRPRKDVSISTPSGRKGWRSTRTPVSYNEDSEDEEYETRSRGRKKRRDSSDFVIMGVAVTEDVESVHMVKEEDILEVVEITPMSSEEEDIEFLPRRAKISRVNNRESRRSTYNEKIYPSPSRGRRRRSTRTPITYTEDSDEELKIINHMEKKYTEPENTRRKQNVMVNQISKENFREVRVMLKKLKKVKPKTLDPLFNCDFSKCKKTFKTKKECDLHREDVHLYKCTKCIGTIIFETKSVFQAHMKKYHDLPCSECLLIFDHEETLAKHQEVVHPHCAVCEDEFSWPSPGHSCPFTQRRPGGKY